VEAVGFLPRAAELTQYLLIPEPKGGRRGVALYTSLYRVWAKGRKYLADAWERQNARPFFAAAAGSGPLDAVWRQAAAAEVAGAKGRSFAASLHDMAQFSDRFSHQIMLDRAARHGFPMAVARLTLNVYRGPRAIVGLRVVVGKCYAGRSVGAGDVFATTWVKVYTISAFDDWTAAWPTVQLDAFIDDVVISTDCPEDVVPARLQGAVSGFLEGAVVDIEAIVAPGKGGHRRVKQARGG